ncbi:MAG: hypothetical protein JW942_09920 [Opitutales bacterium]|nr:hypothetical protein [Opitutales bacterium]
MSFRKIAAILSLCAALLPNARAEAQTEQAKDLASEAPQTKDLVAELAAQKERNAEETRSLQAQLDAVYNDLQREKAQREKAMQAVLLTAAISGGVVAIALILFYRNKLKSSTELKAMNERLDMQWKDLCKANEELTRTNSEMAAAITTLSTQPAKEDVGAKSKDTKEAPANKAESVAAAPSAPVKPAAQASKPAQKTAKGGKGATSRKK